MLSPINGSLTGSWVAALGLTFGWGMYLFPIGLMATGLWLVLRNFERVPQLSFERLLGLISALPVDCWPHSITSICWPPVKQRWSWPN